MLTGLVQYAKGKVTRVQLPEDSRGTEPTDLLVCKFENTTEPDLCCFNEVDPVSLIRGGYADGYTTDDADERGCSRYDRILLDEHGDVREFRGEIPDGYLSLDLDPNNLTDLQRQHWKRSKGPEGSILITSRGNVPVGHLVEGDPIHAFQFYDGCAWSDDEILDSRLVPHTYIVRTIF